MPKGYAFSMSLYYMQSTRGEQAWHQTALAHSHDGIHPVLMAFIHSSFPLVKSKI
jgi:hypothetical protein